jgi:hypothetical protein
MYIYILILLNQFYVFFFNRIPTKAHTLNVQEKWHSGYYGTRMDMLRRIVDSGDLHVSGKLSTLY